MDDILVTNNSNGISPPKKSSHEYVNRKAISELLA